jgi:MFS family permease
VSITLFGFVTWLPAALIFLGLAGAADEISGLFRSTIWNQTIPDALRGRLAGIEMISYTSGPAFGDLESGTIAAVFSVRASVVSGGVFCVIGTVLMALALPAFVSYDARNHLGEEQALARRV